MKKVIIFAIIVICLPIIVNSQKNINNKEIYNVIKKYSQICIDSILLKSGRGNGYELFIINIAKLDIENKIVSFSVGCIHSEGELDEVKATNYIFVKSRLVFVKSIKLKKELTNELELSLIDDKLIKEVKKGLLTGFGNTGYPIRLIVNYIDGKVTWGYKVIKGVSIHDYM